MRQYSATRMPGSLVASWRSTGKNASTARHDPPFLLACVYAQAGRMDAFPVVKDSRTTLYPASGPSRKFFNTWACGKRLMPRRIATPREQRSPWILSTVSQCKKPSPPLGGGLTSDCLEDFWVFGGYTSKRNSYYFIILTLLERPDYKPRRLNC